MKAQDILKLYREAHGKIDHINQQLKDLEKIPQYIAAHEQARLEHRLSLLVQLIGAVNATLELLDEKERSIIELRCISQMKWVPIAMRLHYSQRQAQYIYTAALNKLNHEFALNKELHNVYRELTGDKADKYNIHFRLL